MSEAIREVIGFLEAERDEAVERSRRADEAAEESEALGPQNLMGQTLRRSAVRERHWASQLDEALSVLRDALKERV